LIIENQQIRQEIDKKTLSELEKKTNDFNKKYEEFKKISEKYIKKKETITAVPRVITISGTIGSGKTTKAKHLEKHLKSLGYKVYRIVEQVIINKYKQVIDEINEIYDYHYIIIDRGFKEIEIFTEINIKDEKIRDYLKKQIELIKLNYYNDVIHVRPKKETAIKRKESRNRS
ncbi:39713_t:CDS:2, partial [Gigaspora margarita]